MHMQYIYSTNTVYSCCYSTGRKTTVMVDAKLM